jgi:DNA-binding transcriptional LysR family regulator
VAAEELDLNLLPVLEAVLNEGNVTRAAERLHLSQPAVSHALARARRALGDPLLVRAGRSLVLTPEGRRLAAEVPAIMRRIRTQVTPGGDDLAATSRRFTVGVPEVLGGVVGSLVHDRLARAAPHASLELHHLTTGTDGALLDGTLDAAIGVAGSWAQPVRSTFLAGVAWRPAVAAEHPAAGRHLSLAELAELPHADVANPFVIDAIDAALGARGLHRRVRVVVVNVPALAELLAGSDLVGFLPSFLELPPRLRWVDLPDDLAMATYQLWWGQGSDRDPLATWLRRQLLAVGSELRARSQAPEG